ncbi:J domain-containing protein [Gulosibacter sp. GYB002]|uniref:J domain-containing protein n=1 Tax=Gulosibacter sp. GYB002 TaxID=2994391 RepID=UPI002F9635BA
MNFRSTDYPENLYRVLGVDPSASEDEIRRASRIKQRETHPDLGGTPEAFMRVRLAVEVLTDPQRRAAHDAWLATTSGQVMPARRAPGPRLRQQQRSPRRAATPTSPAQPAARHTAAGTDVPVFDRIPKPEPQLRKMSWYRQSWDHPVEVWPAARAAAPSVTLREFVTVGPFVLASVLVVLALAIPASPLFTVWWPIALLLVLLGAAWLWLRGDARPQPLVSTVLWIFVAGVSLSAAASFFDAMLGIFTGPDSPTGARIVRGVSALAVLALAVLAWWGLQPRVKRMQFERLLMRIADESAPAADDTTRVYGQPGATAMTRSQPGVHPLRRQCAERVVGEALDALQRLPGVRIVHGLRIPGGDDQIATISHAVVAGRRVAFIDSELRAPAHYALDARGSITRDGVPSSTGTEFPHRVERLHEYFGDVAEVRGWLVLVPERAGEFAVDNSRTWPRVRLASVESMLREVGDWLVTDGNSLDRLLLRDLVDLRVEP